MKDLLLYISDQHAYRQQSYAGDTLVRTPNLERIAAAGTVMQNAVTPYPLCAPARMSLMSGQLPSRCGVMNNMTALDSNRATFVHCLDAAGYETVLCGRMHFVGPDQRHGFGKRIAGEQTPIFPNRPNEALARERGVHDRTPQGGLSCLSAIGGGDSPTLAYDRDVVKAALEWLETDHEKPQFLCVGTYGPHHPFVAPRDLYEYYYDRVTVPEHSFSYPEHPALAGTLTRDPDPEVVRAVRAAYYGMVEFEDQQIGRVYDAFQAYLARTGHEGVFVYVSDHGEHAGHRGYYGKSTFYEPSVHIPMVFAGDKIVAGRKLYGAVSLLDIGPTLCEMAGTDQDGLYPPYADGVSLYPQLTGKADDTQRMVVSELGGDFHYQGVKNKEFYYGQMVKYRSFKLIHFDGYEKDDLFYDLAADPEESENVIGKYPDLAASMRDYARRTAAPAELLKERAIRLRENLKILVRCDYDDPNERWHAPECARHYPDPMVKSKLV